MTDGTGFRTRSVRGNAGLYLGFWIEMTAVPYVIWKRSVSEKDMTLITRQTASPKTVRLRVIVMAIALVIWSLPTVADESSL